jgi:hypothetical protein
LYHVARGHSQGEIEPIYLMLTTYGVYILIKREKKESVDTNANQIVNNNSMVKFIKESFIGHNQIDYIEVNLS